MRTSKESERFAERGLPNAGTPSAAKREIINYSNPNSSTIVALASGSSEVAWSSA